MPRKIENYLPPVKEDGLRTDKAVVFGSTLAVTGVVTLSAAPVFSGGAPLRSDVQLSALVGATVVLTSAMNGATLINRSTSGSPSWTLPTNVAGTYFTFYVRDVTTGFTVTGGTIKAKTNAAGTAISGTTLTNTQGTAVVGDTITLLADGTNWIAIAQSGIFAAS